MNESKATPRGRSGSWHGVSPHVRSEDSAPVGPPDTVPPPSPPVFLGHARHLRLLGYCFFWLPLAAPLPGGGRGGAGAPGGGPAPAATRAGAPAGSVEVVVSTSPEKLTLLTELAEKFNRQKVKVGGKPVYVWTQKTSSGEGADLLVKDWKGTSQRKPAVWSPAASAWGGIVTQRRTAAGKKTPIGDFSPIQVTPLVIAMPKPMAEALGWPNTPIGWADVAALAQDPQGWAKYGHPEWGAFKLGKTDPNISTSGLNATIATDYAAAGKVRDLTVADLDRPEVRAFIQGVEGSVVHYGDTTLAFLNNLYKADRRGAALAYVSAVAVEEKSVIDYNSGDPDGILDPGEKAKKPRVPLVAVYPKEGTLWSDNPYFVLDAPWVTRAQKEGARRFEDYVTKRRQSQLQTLRFGFRPADPAIPLKAPIDAANGLDPRQPQTILPVPGPEVLVKALDVWASTRKTARVLLVLDVSGSMGDPAGVGDTTKLELAQQAVLGSLDDFQDRDEVGLWIFSTNLDGDRDFKELVPMEAIGPNRQRIAQMVRGLSPLQGTGLYDATTESVKAVEKVASADRINAVVLLTDGRNEDDTNDDLDGLVRWLGRRGEARPVRVFAIAYGEDADQGALRKIVDATQGNLYVSADPKDIKKVFRNVVSNF